MAKGFEKVLKNDLCAGCGLCSSVFSEVSLEYNSKGYIRPTDVKLSEKEDKLFQSFCPGYSIKHELGSVKDYVWGSQEDVVLAYSENKEVRHSASSGGVITAMLLFLLEKGYVDAVIHTGVSKENPLLNSVIISETRESIVANLGSRYSPSAPLQNIAQLLDENKTYAFVGKPCDVGALRMYSQVDERVKKKVPYVLSFFCAGVPSIEGTKKLLENFDVKAEEVESLRYRGEGWPGMTKIVTKDDRVFTMKYDDSWGKILNRYLQRRCKVCIDGIGEFADLVCGDGWFGDDKGYPTFEEQEGRSLVVLRNNIGKDIFYDAVAAGYIKVDSMVDFKYLKNIQPFQYDRRTTLVAKLISMKIFRIETPKYNWKIMFKAAGKSNAKRLVKTFVGTSQRIIKGKL